MIQNSKGVVGEVAKEKECKATCRAKYIFPLDLLLLLAVFVQNVQWND